MSKEINDIEWWHRIQLKDGSYTPGRVWHGEDGGDWPTTRFGLPASCEGLSVLDIGAWDGFFSFEAEKRGASEVQAVDTFQGRDPVTAIDGFDYAWHNLGSKVMYGYANIENDPYALGNIRYDLVLLFGVLYHSENPMRILRNVWKNVKPGGTLLIETTVADGDGFAIEIRDGYDGDQTNFTYFTRLGMILALKRIGFVDIELFYDMGVRATFRCKRPNV